MRQSEDRASVDGEAKQGNETEAGWRGTALRERLLRPYARTDASGAHAFPRFA